MFLLIKPISVGPGPSGDSTLLPVGVGRASGGAPIWITELVSISGRGSIRGFSFRE